MRIGQLEGDRVVLRPVWATEVDALEVMFTESASRDPVAVLLEWEG